MKEKRICKEMSALNSYRASQVELDQEKAKTSVVRKQRDTALEERDNAIGRLGDVTKELNDLKKEKNKS